MKVKQILLKLNLFPKRLDGKVIKLDDMIKMNRVIFTIMLHQSLSKIIAKFCKRKYPSYNGATSGAIGPGELAPAMLGDPASKATSAAIRPR